MERTVKQMVTCHVLHLEEGRRGCDSRSLRHHDELPVVPVLGPAMFVVYKTTASGCLAMTTMMTSLQVISCCRTEIEKGKVWY